MKTLWGIPILGIIFILWRLSKTISEMRLEKKTKEKTKNMTPEELDEYYRKLNRELKEFKEKPSTGLTRIIEIMVKIFAITILVGLAIWLIIILLTN